MKGQAPQQRLRQFTLKLTYITGVLLVLIGVGELTARLMGHRPWREPHQRISIRPHGSLYQPDSLLGYRGRPGSFELLLQDSLRFTVTHNAEGWRQGDSLPDSLPQIWVLGCSFTHGFGVSDPDPYPARLQALLPAFHVRNFGMDGYGTLHNWLTLATLLTRGERPHTVILGYGAFHDQRNTANRYWRKALHGQQIAEGLRYPYIRLDEQDSLHIHYEHLAYHPLPMQRRLALLSLIEENWNRSEDKGLRSKEVTEILLHRIHHACQGVGANFILAGIYRHPETETKLARFRQRGLLAVDISQDLHAPGLRILPGNGHPNPQAHLRMANVLYRFFTETVLLKQASQSP